jgi:hypothetical protein
MDQAKTSGRFNARASIMVRDIEEMGGVRWDGEASARLQVVTWVYGRAMPPPPRDFKSLFGGGRRPPRSIRPKFHRLNIEVIAFNSAIPVRQS